MTFDRFRPAGMTALYLVAAVAALSLGACDSLIYNTPTALTSAGIETYRDDFVFEADTAVIGPAQIKDIGQHYWRHGETPLQGMVTYDPRSATNTAMKATQEAARLKAAFAENGIKNVTIDVVPVVDAGDVSHTLIAFETLHARAPSECGEDVVADQEFTEWGQYGDDYKLGCVQKTYAARQIARPRDLHGSDIMDKNDGRKTANSLEYYRAGEPNPELQGESASE